MNCFCSITNSRLLFCSRRTFTTRSSLWASSNTFYCSPQIHVLTQQKAEPGPLLFSFGWMLKFEELEWPLSRERLASLCDHWIICGWLKIIGQRLNTQNQFDVDVILDLLTSCFYFLHLFVFSISLICLINSYIVLPRHRYYTTNY